MDRCVHWVSCVRWPLRCVRCVEWNPCLSHYRLCSVSGVVCRNLVVWHKDRSKCGCHRRKADDQIVSYRQSSTADRGATILRYSTTAEAKWQLTITTGMIDLLSAELIVWYYIFWIIFTRESSYCFQRILAIAILSIRLSVRLFVRLSVTRVDQSKAVQTRITKFSPSAAWKTLVLGTVKLFHKFKVGHPERGR